MLLRSDLSQITSASYLRVSILVLLTVQLGQGAQSILLLTARFSFDKHTRRYDTNVCTGVSARQHVTPIFHLVPGMVLVNVQTKDQHYS